jgi:hypothetical protein
LAFAPDSRSEKLASGFIGDNESRRPEIHPRIVAAIAARVRGSFGDLKFHLVWSVGGLVCLLATGEQSSIFPDSSTKKIKSGAFSSESLENTGKNRHKKPPPRLETKAAGRVWMSA